MRERAKEQIEALGLELYGNSDPDQLSQNLKRFFSELGSPVKCQEAGIDPARKDEILQLLNQNKADGVHFSLSDSEREDILNLTC